MRAATTSGGGDIVIGSYEPSAELTDLLIALTAGELTVEQRTRLNNIVSSDRNAREYYVDYISTHALLDIMHQGAPVPDIPLIVDDGGLLPKHSRSRSMWFGLAVALSLLIVVSIGIHQAGNQDHWLDVGSILVDPDLRWDNHGPVSPDGRLRPGRGSITAGQAQLRLNTGVAIAIQGDAEFEVLADTKRFHLTHGRMRVRVPHEAVGFTVLAAGHDIVDLGTEFGVSVDENSAIEIHVFEGAVRVADQYELHAGDAELINRDGQLGEPRLKAKQFPPIR